jgi:hypothetical protein
MMTSQTPRQNEWLGDCYLVVCLMIELAVAPGSIPGLAGRIKRFSRGRVAADQRKARLLLGALGRVGLVLEEAMPAENGNWTMYSLTTEGRAISQSLGSGLVGLLWPRKQ